MAHVSMGQNVFFEGDREKGIQYVNEAVTIYNDLIQRIRQQEVRDQILALNFVFRFQISSEKV
jgi:hypothetical protein